MGLTDLESPLALNPKPWTLNPKPQNQNPWRSSLAGAAPQSLEPDGAGGVYLKDHGDLVTPVTNKVSVLFIAYIPI